MAAITTAARPALRALAVLAALAAVTALVVLLASSEPAGRIVHLDRLVVGALHDLAADEATSVVLVLTDLGGTTVVLWVCALAGLALCCGRHWVGVLALVGSVAATQGTVALVKGLVERPRPAGSDALVDAAGYGFPSAHAATAAALYGVLGLIACTRLHGRARVVASGCALAIAVLIGLTRVYLGAHYPTDVVAGWLVGAAIGACSWWLARAATRSRAAARPAPAR